MTEAQRLMNSYCSAAEVFDDDIQALAVALGGMLKRAGKKHDVEYVLRELNESRFKKFEKFFPRIDNMCDEEIEQCKAYAQCRFGKELGRLEEVEKLSARSETMPKRLIEQEVKNIDAMMEALSKIKSNLQNNVVSPVPKVMNGIRGNLHGNC